MSSEYEIMSKARRLVSQEELELKTVRHKNMIYKKKLRDFQEHLQNKITTDRKKCQQIERSTSVCSYFSNETLLKRIDSEIGELKNIKYANNYKSSKEYPVKDHCYNRKGKNEIFLPHIQTDITDAVLLPNLVKPMEIKIRINKNKEYLMITWIAWRNYVSDRKISKDLERLQEEKLSKINNFVKEMKLNCVVSRTYIKSNFSPYQKKTTTKSNKLEGAKLHDILKQQRAKIKEQQKMINKLKLEQVKAENSTSIKIIKEQMKDSLTDVTLAITRRKLNLLNLNYIQNRQSFIVEMERREKERLLKKQEIKELTQNRIIEKRKLQLEKEKQLKEEMREKAKLEKEQRILELQEEANMRAKNKNAEIFCRKRRLKLVFGIFKQLIKLKEIMLKIATEHYHTQLKIKVLQIIKLNYLNVIENRKLQVHLIHKKYIEKRAWNKWRQCCIKTRRNWQVAEDFYDLVIISQSFGKWHEIIIKNLNYVTIQMNIAHDFHERKLLHTCFLCWRRLHEDREIELRKERKKTALRNAVRIVLPDFRPVVFS